MKQFVEAHTAILKEIRLVEKTVTETPEQEMAKHRQLEMLNLRREDVRLQAMDWTEEEKESLIEKAKKWFSKKQAPQKETARIIPVNGYIAPNGTTVNLEYLDSIYGGDNT